MGGWVGVNHSAAQRFRPEIIKGVNPASKEALWVNSLPGSSFGLTPPPRPHKTVLEPVGKTRDRPQQVLVLSRPVIVLL